MKLSILCNCQTDQFLSLKANYVQKSKKYNKNIINRTKYKTFDRKYQQKTQVRDYKNIRYLKTKNNKIRENN